MAINHNSISLNSQKCNSHHVEFSILPKVVEVSIRIYQVQIEISITSHLHKNQNRTSKLLAGYLACLNIILKPNGEEVILI